jgi:hypothetical protein
MLPENILQALRAVYGRIQNKGVLWILTGSASLSIQGVDVKINDLDILTDKEGSQKIDGLLSCFRAKKPVYSATEKYRSFFGAYLVEGVRVEVFGQFQYKMKDGSWSKQNHLNKAFAKEFEGMDLSLLPLGQELQEYESTGNPGKVLKIKQVLVKSRQSKN